MTDERITREQIIADARKLYDDPAEFDAEISHNGPGKYEGTDRALAVALETIYGHGFSDDQAGSTEYGLHLSRVDRFVLATDDRGFCDALEFETVALAQAELDAEDSRQNPTVPCPDCGGTGILSESEACAVSERDNRPIEVVRGYCGRCEALGTIAVDEETI